jgi:hypothetical protein
MVTLPAVGTRGATDRARRQQVVQLLDVLTPDGGTLLVARSSTDPLRGYLQRPGASGWVCGCRGFVFRGRCSHVEAAASRRPPDASAGP